MNNHFPPDVQQAIQSSLQEIALRIGQSLNASAAEQLYADAISFQTFPPTIHCR
jgi:hypothetical protein